MEQGHLRKYQLYVAHLDFYLMVATPVKDATLFYIDELFKSHIKA